MAPTIVAFDVLRFAGLKISVRSSLTAPNDMHGVPALWQSLASLAPTLPSRVGDERYALITGDLPHGKAGRADYYALFAVKDFRDLPSALVTFEVTSGRLASVRHKGSPQTVGVTAMRLLNEWLPQSGESLAMNLELFTYPPGYDRNDPRGEFSYGLFLK